MNLKKNITWERKYSFARWCIIIQVKRKWWTRDHKQVKLATAYISITNSVGHKRHSPYAQGIYIFPLNNQPHHFLVKSVKSSQTRKTLVSFSRFTQPLMQGPIHLSETISISKLLCVEGIFLVWGVKLQLVPKWSSMVRVHGLQNLELNLR